MENNGINKGKVSLGATICLVSYFIICLIIKAFGLDLFEITNHIEWAAGLSYTIYTNLFLLTLLQTIFMEINLFFVFSVSTSRYEAKKMLLLTLIAFIPVFGINILFNYFRLPTFIASSIIPLIFCLLLVKDRKNYKEYIFTAIRYAIFMAFISLVQIGLIYLKITLLKFNYNAGNVLNVILLNLDLFVIYFSIYFLLKYTKLREWTCNLCKKICGKIFKRKQKKED